MKSYFEEQKRKRKYMMTRVNIFFTPWDDPTKRTTYRRFEVTPKQEDRYEWFFDYVRAKCKMEHPKSRVFLTYSVFFPSKHTESKYLQNKISSNKRMITKIRNGIAELRDYYNQTLFPEEIYSDNLYQKAQDKLKKYEIELEANQNRLNKMD